ncbi:hypothetical protein CALCODRAFT_490435 [Calocera cornea HHB12733]|uniref:Uncharacterized protein n=1 Tax=Calocera cornea HHB12733 TaxID=1353952 RepID=A0A165JT23_9BASI|nr:hypothetical protein CALCODRAFT_490435 [Calocera cornea HHB12733]
MHHENVFCERTYNAQRVIFNLIMHAAELPRPVRDHEHAPCPPSALSSPRAQPRLIADVRIFSLFAGMLVCWPPTNIGSPWLVEPR